MTTDLQVNREYLDTKFQGYKLNTAVLSLHSKHVPEGIFVVRPSDDQYSFLQQREFSLYNHLHSDPWDPCSVYIITSEKKIKKIIVDNKDDGRLDVFYDVWEIPVSEGIISGQFNISICFVTADLVIVSDGAGSLHILSTGDRKQTSGLWKEIHCEDVNKPIRIADARCLSSTEIHCLCCYVDNKQSYVTHYYFTSKEKNIWHLERTETLFGKGSLDYIALDCNCQNAYIVGQVELKSQEFIDEENKKPSDDSKKKEISFEWQQNYDEIKLWLRITEDQKPAVHPTSQQLQIKAPDGKIILQGKLYRPIEPELTVWQHIKKEEEEAKFEITLSKRDEGNMWPLLFESSEFHGKEVLDSEIVADIHSKLAHLTSESQDVGGATVLNSGQLEECDITDGEGRLLVQYDLTSSLIPPIHKIELGNGQWLMCGPRSVKHPPHFCLRSDVDGIVWEIRGKTLQHKATLCAYGFVQASKSSRLFSFLPSDSSYSGLVDADGRVFIYCGGVRPNNKGEWGSQHIVSLGKTKILGVYATSMNVFILSENDLYAIKLLDPIE